jgi:hypothetical protein
LIDQARAEHPWVAEGKSQLRFGTNLPGSDDWAKDRDDAQAIEGLGFDSGMAGEHPSGGADCWTTLAAYAAVTTRLRLISISCVYYRSPQLLVRHATDVDLLSGGRLVLGLGAGWAKGDFDYLGIPFPPAAERVRYLEETIRTVRQLWSDPPTVTSELLGYTFGGPCCDERGRAFDSVVRSHYLNTVILAKNEDEANSRLNALPPIFRNSGFFQGMTPRELIAYYRPIIDAGANYLYFNQTGGDVPSLRLFAESVMPELQDYYASTVA